MDSCVKLVMLLDIQTIETRENMSGYTFGYARVSTSEQNLDRQLEAIGEVDEMITDKASGKDRAGRAGLTELMGKVRKGDTIKVKSVDRLARSSRDLLNIMEELSDKGVAVEFTDNPEMSMNTTVGKLVLTILAAVAEMDRATIKERQAEGIELAKARGAFAKKHALSAEQIAEARQRVADGVAKAQVARDLGVSRQTLYTALKAV